MLTPAEERGLAGLALASRVQHALSRLAPAELAGIIERLRAGALAHHVVYLHEGEVEPIRILPAPITILPDQLAYMHHVSLTMQNALKRLPDALPRATSASARFSACRTRRRRGSGSAGARARTRNNPGLRPARRGGGLHQPDVEGVAAVRGAEPHAASAACTSCPPASG